MEIVRALEVNTFAAETLEFDVSTLLQRAADVGIVEPLEQLARWRFTHVLLREGLYEELLPARRAALHQAAAGELGRRTGGPPLAELAHHLLLAVPAGGVGAAANAALRAAERAMDLLAFEDASALLERAAKLIEGVAGEERRFFEVLLGLGVARIRAAEIELGQETCRRAAELARRLGDGELFARAVLGSAYEFTPGVRDVALIALLEEALAALPAGDGTLRARCMAQLAAERQPEPDTQGPIEFARAAVTMARRVGDPDTLRVTLAIAGLAMVAYAEPGGAGGVQSGGLAPRDCRWRQAGGASGEPISLRRLVATGRCEPGPRPCARPRRAGARVPSQPLALDLVSVSCRDRSLGGALRGGRAMA